MSSGIRVLWSDGMDIADRVIGILRQECVRIEIAGSLRRLKQTVGDIEIVLIPKPTFDLFDGEIFGSTRIEAALIRYGYQLQKNGLFFKQTVDLLTGVNIDIFLTTPKKWGVVFTIRTGSAEFSHRLVTSKSMGGRCPGHLKFKDGRIWSGEKVLDTPEEKDVFIALGMEYIEPKLREAA